MRPTSCPSARGKVPRPTEPLQGSHPSFRPIRLPALPEDGSLHSGQLPRGRRIDRRLTGQRPETIDPVDDGWMR